MSWDIWLEDAETKEQTDESLNYTHNTNRMLALSDGFSFNDLHGMSCAGAIPRLERVITFLALNREQCEALNPENGWGNYDGILKFTQRLYEACRRQATRVDRASNCVIKVWG